MTKNSKIFVILCVVILCVISFIFVVFNDNLFRVSSQKQQSDFEEACESIIEYYSQERNIYEEFKNDPENHVKAEVAKFNTNKAVCCYDELISSARANPYIDISTVMESLPRIE